MFTTHFIFETSFNCMFYCMLSNITMMWTLFITYVILKRVFCLMYCFIFIKEYIWGFFMALLKFINFLVTNTKISFYTWKKRLHKFSYPTITHYFFIRIKSLKGHIIGHLIIKFWWNSYLINCAVCVPHRTLWMSK